MKMQPLLHLDDCGAGWSTTWHFVPAHRKTVILGCPPIFKTLLDVPTEERLCRWDVPDVIMCVSCVDVTIYPLAGTSTFPRYDLYIYQACSDVRLSTELEHLPTANIVKTTIGSGVGSLLYRVCLGHARHAVNLGRMSVLEAYWNTTFFLSHRGQDDPILPRGTNLRLPSISPGRVNTLVSMIGLRATDNYSYVTVFGHE
jgi:hypothetical protein